MAYATATNATLGNSPFLPAFANSVVSPPILLKKSVPPRALKTPPPTSSPGLAWQSSPSPYRAWCDGAGRATFNQKRIRMAASDCFMVARVFRLTRSHTATRWAHAEGRQSLSDSGRFLGPGIPLGVALDQVGRWVFVVTVIVCHLSCVAARHVPSWPVVRVRAGHMTATRTRSVLNAIDGCALQTTPIHAG